MLAGARGLLPGAFPDQLHNPRPGLLQRVGMGRRYFVNLDDVIAVLGFDHPAQLAGLKAEGGIFERLNHLAALKEAQVATPVAGSLII